MVNPRGSRVFQVTRLIKHKAELMIMFNRVGVSGGVLLEKESKSWGNAVYVC